MRGLSSDDVEKGLCLLNLAHTVLLIDDNVKLFRALERSLTVMSNMRVVTAQDGAEGLEQFFAVRPDCVVIDVRMPELDGYQLVRACGMIPARPARR